MPGKIEVLSILLILLPGLLSAYITQQLAVRRAQSDFDKVVEALVFSFILYVLTLPFFGGMLPVSWQPLPDGNYHVSVAYKHLCVLLLSSVLFGLLYSSSINHDWLLWCLRKMKVTERTARRSIWNDTFQEIGGYVQVTLKEGRRVIGWVRYYSDEPEDNSLFLENAAWVKDNGEVEPINGPGILLTKESSVESVMFLTWQTSDEKSPEPSELDSDT